MITFKLILAFFGVALTSFILFYVALSSGHEETLDAMGNKDKKVLKEVEKGLKDSPTTLRSMVMSKWMSFGGGFYGVVAVMTYVVVEFWEVVDLLSSDKGIVDAISQLGMGDLVNFFVNSLMNFITAIAWPAYWINLIDRTSIWVGFLVIYAGYMVGQTAAKWYRNTSLVE